MRRLAPLGWWLLAACRGSSPYDAWCAEAQDCDGRSRIDCVRSLEAAEADAEATACRDPFDRWTTCLEQQATCDGSVLVETACSLEADDLLECQRAAGTAPLDADVHEYCVLSDSCHDASTPDGAYGPCVESMLDLQEAARAAGCTFDHQLWIRCVTDQGTCSDGGPDGASCASRASELADCLDGV